MAYKVYVSMSDDLQASGCMAVVQRALFSINEYAITAITGMPADQTRSDYLQIAQHLIDQADIFIGIYGTSYGNIIAGENADHAESTYHYAVETDKTALIFVKDGALDTADKRQQQFLRHILERHVVRYFDDNEDLAAQIKVGLDRYRQMKMGKRLRPAAQNFRGLPSAPRTAPDTLVQTVERALEIAGDDIEQIVRRALELHDAQQQVSVQPNDAYDGKLTVTPLWGEPLRRSQFQSDVFMIMPFRERFDGIYRSSIIPLVESLNLSIKRGDDFSSTRGAIIQEVWAALNACRLVIAETTEINANVYYELGIAHTLGKPAILLTQMQTPEELPFDLRHLRFIVYEDSIEGSAKLEEDLRQAIIWLLNDLDEMNGTPPSQ